MRRRFTLTQYAVATMGALSLPLIYFVSRYQYNLFHSIADGVSIVIAACAFAVIWNSRRLVDNDYFLYAGISFLFFAFLDAMHLLGNKNMGIFPGYGNLGPTFYIASRYVLSISLIIAPLFINRKLNTVVMFGAYSLVTILILLSVFYWRVFPACIVEGVGLTRFKIVSDYIICLILAGAAGLLLINRTSFEPRVLRIIVSSIVLSIATGLTFTLYTDPFGITNMVGHLFQFGSFYLIYLAFIETSVTRPQEILFRKLKQNEEELTENLRLLDHANAVLQQEIAERKRAEEAVRLSEEKFALSFASNPAAVALTRLEDGAILEVNDTYVSLSGYAREEVIGRSARQMGIWPSTEASSRFVQELQKKGFLRGWEQEFLKKSGETFIVELWAQVLTLRGEKLILSTMVDITERKKVEDALKAVHAELELRVRERTAELQEANTRLEAEIAERERVEEELRQAQKMEALGTLTGGIAHDFNNMLAGIIGFTEMALDDDIPHDSPKRRHLELVLKSGFRGRDLVRQLLTFARKTDDEKKPLSLTPLIEETGKLLRASIPTTIDIKVDTRANSDIILANATGIQQIVMNLCMNAAHAMAGAGGKLVITLADAGVMPGLELPPGEYIELTVQDTGTGMEPELVKRIFEPFFTTKEVGQGTGMGLAVVYGIVKGFKGDITVESLPGVGSTFRVLFPKIPVEEASEPSEKAAVPTGNERILFVDDEEMLAELGRGMLGRLGYNVTTTTSSVKALKLFSEDPARFDLIITDQTMPHISGLRLAGQLLKVRPDIPIILCSGHSESLNAQAIATAGIAKFLMKPLARQVLAETVRQVLDKRP
jgi:PAS domain S-box-containing protein